eukprot:3419034-Amphidinium_carterae.1
MGTSPTLTEVPALRGQSQKGGRLFVFVVPDDKKKRCVAAHDYSHQSADGSLTKSFSPKT